MRFFNIFLLALVFSSAQAGQLIFSNNNEQVNISGDVLIDNQNGDVTVTTEGGDFLIVSENQPVILGFYPDDYEIVNGDTIVANWTVVNATNCSASTTQGDTSWAGTKSSVDGNNSQAGVSINQLPSTLSLVCSNGNDSVTKSFEISAQPTSNNNPSIDTFTVNGQPSFVTVASTANVASFIWSTSDVNSCTASSSPALSGWNGSKALSGNQDILISEDTTVTLTCDNVPTRSITINYSEGVDPSCSSVQTPPQSSNAVIMTYAEANDGFLFGASTGSKVVEPFRTDQHLALSDFFTNEVNYRRRIDFFPAPTDQRPTHVVTYSVSTCPGDFTASAVCTGFLIGSSLGQINFSTRTSDIGNSNYCNLTVGEEYYLNFVHDNNPYDSTAPRCGFTSDQTCAINATEIDNN